MLAQFLLVLVVGAAVFHADDGTNFFDRALASRPLNQVCRQIRSNRSVAAARHCSAHTQIHGARLKENIGIAKVGQESSGGGGGGRRQSARPIVSTARGTPL